MSDRRRGAVVVWALLTPAVVAFVAYLLSGAWAPCILGLLAAWLLVLMGGAWRVAYHRGKMGPMSNDTPAKTATHDAPVPADVTPAYAIGWLGAALEQVVANDGAITGYEVVSADVDRVIVGMLVHGVPISLSYNVTP